MDDGREPGAQRSHQHDGNDRRPARHRKGPGLIDQQRAGDREQQGARRLAGRHAHRRLADETVRVDGRQRIEQRRGEDRELREQGGSAAHEGSSADEHGHADDADDDPHQLVDRQFLVVRQGMGDEEPDERRRRRQDGGKPARHLLLAPDDEAGRDQRVERTEDQVGFPAGERRRQPRRRDRGGKQQDRHARNEPARHDGRRRHFPDGDGLENVGAAPEH